MSGFGCSKSEPAPEPSTMSCNMSSCLCLDVVAKARIVATNFLIFCRSGDGLARA